MYTPMLQWPMCTFAEYGVTKSILIGAYLVMGMFNARIFPLCPNQVLLLIILTGLKRLLFVFLFMGCCHACISVDN